MIKDRIHKRILSSSKYMHLYISEDLIILKAYNVATATTRVTIKRINVRSTIPATVDVELFAIAKVAEIVMEFKVDVEVTSDGK